MGERPADTVERYEIVVDGQRYAGAPRASTAERIAADAAREHPRGHVRIRVVGDGRTRAARAAARLRFPDHRVTIRLVTDATEVTHYAVRARRPIAGGYRETRANVWIDEHGRARWGGEPGDEDPIA